MLSTERNDMGEKEQEKDDRKFRLTDLLIILLCLFGAAFCVNLFRIDLLSTLDAKNEKPVGTIIIKNNIVQRRMANRILWDRLTVDSPAYMGDLIRTADISSAALHVESSSLELGEKTLIRIQRSPDGDGLIQIDLVEGNLSLAAGADDGGIVLNLMGHHVEFSPGTILKASMEEDGIVVKVSEGNATFIDNGQRREIPFGSMIALDANGVERMEKAAAPAVVAIHPRPNARYLKNKPEPMHINFIWSRINLDSGDRLRLEIAEDKNFKRIIKVINAAGGNTAEATLDSGIWYWRLSSMETAASNHILSTERFSITDAAGPTLLSPVTDSLFHYYQDDLPQLRFQWSEIENVSSYILEVSETPDFINTWLHMQTASVFFLDSSLGQGKWYWQVMPVFPSVYEGNAAFSPAASFRIERGGPNDAALVLPQPVIEQPKPVVAQPEPVIEKPKPKPKPVPVKLSLLSPSSGSSLAGLTALRQQTVFRWDNEGNIERSRFILSKNSNPLQGRPEVELINPGKTVRLNRLKEGTYYWTVEARSPDGLISSATPRQLRILPIPLLPAPLNLQPPEGHRIGIEQLMDSDSIVFSWSQVQGANAYILTLYEKTDNGQRQIMNRPPQNNTRWTLDNLGTLGRGNFFWQIEAVNRGSAGAIEQRGRIGEGSFIIDIPRPGLIEIEDPGTLYGY